MATNSDPSATGQRLPRRSSRLLKRMVPAAFGVACGTVAASLLALATLVLVARGGETVGPHLGLLALVLPGYSVTALGALVGAAYAFAIAFVAGFLFAIFRNVALGLYLRFVQTRLEHHAASDLLDRLS